MRILIQCQGWQDIRGDDINTFVHWRPEKSGICGILNPKVTGCQEDSKNRIVVKKIVLFAPTSVKII
jgi:hypothetical protein